MARLVARFVFAAALVASASSHQPFDLVAGVPHSSPDALERAFWRISDPSDASSYLRHLSLADAVELVGASDADLEAVQQWLTGMGATEVSVSALRDTVTGRFDDPPTSWDSIGRVLPPATAQPRLDFLFRRHAQHQANHSFLHHRDRGRHNVSSGFGAYTISAQKGAYGIPVDLAASNDSTLQMVWGPGTFGFSMLELQELKRTECPLLNTSRVMFDTANHGAAGGDNYGEGNLDTQMVSSFGLNVHTLVSNTNASSSTEEGQGFGLALLDFVTQLASRPRLPQVLSISLGSLSAFSCDLLCDRAEAKGVERTTCNAFLQEQRQVCMFMDQGQVERINAAFKILGARGVTVFGSSGDGGSHFSFGPFRGGGHVADVLNEISCEALFPVFPTTSPYIISVGGTDWKGIFKPDPDHPEPWSGSGGGFSWQFGAPEYQAKTVAAYLSQHKDAPGFPQAGTAFNASGRAYPDVSAVAVEGTSQSSPTMAGIFSLVTDHRLNAGLPPLGFIGTRLWRTSQAYPGQAFQSVGGGNTKTSCATGFPSSSSAGWDPVTGWGRPMWDGLIKHFGADDARLLARLK